jgi:Ca2+-binding RTX toxin-like protein
VGGSGRDRFDFTSKGITVDRIADFNVVSDLIRLDDGAFTGLHKKGKLSLSAFHKGGAAHDVSDRIIYDSKAGALYYDPDGSGDAQQIQFASLKAALRLTYADFVVI